MFKEKSAAVLAMPIIGNNMPPHSTRKLTDAELFPVDALSRVATDYNASTGERLKEPGCRGIVLENATEETVYANGLLERIGFHDRVLSLAQHEDLITFKKRKALQAFKACDRVPSMAF